MRATRRCLALIPLLVFSCAPLEEEGGSQDYPIQSTGDAVSPGTSLLGDGVWLAYLASEALSGNQDRNGDLDESDQVAVLVNTSSGDRTDLAVACESMAFLNGTLFLVVSEEDDGRDWNLDVDTEDRVLLYVDNSSSTPTIYHELVAGDPTPMAVVGQRLLFSTDTVSLDEFETNLMWTVVPNSGGVPDEQPLAVHSRIDDPPNDDWPGTKLSIWKVVEGLAFLTMDESENGNMNNDSDTSDGAVLALWDGGSPSEPVAEVTTTGLAVDTDGQVDALPSSDTTDWTVAFLVDEADQGENLNVSEWQPQNCLDLDDEDQDDQVLHWCLYSDLIDGAQLGEEEPRVVNTGLVGGGDSSEFVYVMESGSRRFVGCVSLESDQGVQNGCDLNNDLDKDDRVFRWIEATDPATIYFPEADHSKLHAVADSVPGYGGDSTGGVVALKDLWVILVDEQADGQSDHDGNSVEFSNVIAAHNPANAGQTWNFNHGSTAPGPVSVTWLARNPRSRSSFRAAISETVLGTDLNGDGDHDDSVPTFPELLSGNTLSFPGAGVACDLDNAGIVSAAGLGFFRLAEAEDGNEDYNGDGDENDALLIRFSMGGGDTPTVVKSLNTLSGPAVQFSAEGTIRFGAFLFQENQEGASGLDLNKDGDVSDYIVHYFPIS